MPKQRAKDALLRMLDPLCHEDFYVAGTWMDESLGVYVGWVERKGSFSDGMPLRDETGNRVLVFSGEDFSEPSVRRDLRNSGHQFDGDGPSYLVHLSEEDPSFPLRLNGRFHGLLVDRRAGSAMLFNDRYGMHRLYYHDSKDAFYFAAEAKAILAVRPEVRTLNARALGEFVACGAVLENRSLFEGVHVLPPGSSWSFRQGSPVQKKTYFSPSDWENQGTLDPETYYAELRKVFSHSVPRHFSGSRPIAMSLTGGLDTRMVLAWQKPEPDSLPCFTFGSMYRDNHDVRVARKVADLCHQHHEVITAGREFLARFPHYAERAVYLTDGCVDVSRAPDLYVNERARAIAPVRMTGNYGGEILRRVRAFKPEDPLPGLFDPELSAHVRRAKETYTAISAGHPVSFAAFKQGPWHHYGILALEQTQLSMRSPFLDNDFVRTVFRSPASALDGNDVSLRLIADGNKALLRIPTDRGLTGARGSLAGAVSRAMLEFQFKAEYAYDMGMPQPVARIDHALRWLHLERLFLGRHKVFHFRIWYRDVLRDYVREMLLDPLSLSRSYVERNKVEAVVRGHLEGVHNYTNEIHKLLTLEITQRCLLDSAAGSPRKRTADLAAVTVDH